MAALGNWIRTGPDRAFTGTRAALQKPRSWDLRFLTAVNVLKGVAWAFFSTGAFYVAFSRVPLPPVSRLARAVLRRTRCSQQVCGEDLGPS